MSLAKYVNRIERIDNLIKLRATGTPDEFANKLSLGRSTLFKNLQELRNIGLDIKYSTVWQSYYYASNRRLRFSFGSFSVEDEVLKSVS